MNFNINFTMMMMASGSGGGPPPPNNSMTLDYVYQGLPYSFLFLGTEPTDNLDVTYNGLPFGVKII